MLQKVHRYEIGARLLCFEPDTSKAKLIYFAKILRRVSNSKTDEPHYGVHFHGWKCKWDREVPEHLLLENTEFNRTLKRKIDEVARHNASLCGDDVDWDSIPGIWKSSVKTKSHKHIAQPRCEQEEVLAPEKLCFSFDDLELNAMDTEESTQFEFENFQAHELFYIPFPLTSNLASLMDAHAIFGPAELSAVNFGWVSLVQVLQAYLDGFPYKNIQVPNNLLKDKCTGVRSFERLTRQLGPAYTKVDRSQLICAEVCSSLRVLFDSMADDYLILPHEKASIPKYPFWNERFLDYGRAFSIPSSLIPGLQSDSSETSTPSPRYELLPSASASKTPDLPCLVYPAHLILRLFDNLPEILRSMQMSSCRRSIISRHLYLFTQYLEVTRGFWFTKEMPDCMGEFLHSNGVSDVKPGELQAKSGTVVPQQNKRRDRGAKSERSSSADTEPLTTGQSLKPVRRANRPSAATVRHRSRAGVTERPQSELVKQPRFSLRSHGDDQSGRTSELPATTTNTSKTRQQQQQQGNRNPPASPLMCSRNVVERKSRERKNSSSAVLSSDREDEVNTPLSPPKTRISLCLPSATRSDIGIKMEEQEQDKPFSAGARCVGSSHLWRLSTGRPVLTLTASRRQSQATADASHQPADTLPPFRRHRDPTSVLRALNSCIAPVPDAPDFRLGPDPQLGSHLDLRASLLARAKGRLAARLAVSQYFPNDVAALAKEVPRVDRWCPLQSPDSLLAQVSQGQLSPAQAMDKLILLMAPKQAWKLYSEVALSEAWSSELLHRLLDLLCATNSGAGGAHQHTLWDEVDLTNPPDPDEIYFADELTVHFNTQSQVNQDDRRSMAVQQREAIREASEEHHEGEETGEVPLEGGSGEEVLDSGQLQASLNATVKPTGPTSWLVHGPAEQLFTKETKVLNTPTAFCSMIRGASRFSRPERALELAELAWKGFSDGNSCLDVPTYTALIRSLHNLESVKSDHQSLWPLVRSVVERLIASNQPIDVSVFSAILFCLAETVSNENKNSEANATDQYIPIGLSLLDELRKTGLEPSLGVFANLLRVIHYARSSTSTAGTKSTTFSCHALVDAFVSELDCRFRARQPTRGDEWTPDDYSFFPVAMRIAWLESDRALGQRIDSLLTRGPDLRWLLATSLLRRAYVFAYCSLVLDTSSVAYSQTDGKPIESAERLLEKVQSVDQLYRAHWGSIATTNKLSVRLANSLAGHLRAGTCLEEGSRPLVKLAYTCFDNFFNHLTQRSRAMDFNRKVGLRVVELSQVLREFSHCGPHLAAKTSASMLTRLKVASERVANQNTRRTGSRHPLPTLPRDLVHNLVEMTFPALESEVSGADLSGDDSVHWSRQAFATLHDWLVFALDREALAWSWAPKVINTIFRNTEKGDNDNLIWDSLRQLSRMPYRPSSASECNMCRSALEPVLAELEASLPALLSATSGFVTSHLNADERRGLIARLRQTLGEAIVTGKEEEVETRGSAFGGEMEAESRRGRSKKWFAAG